MGPHELLAAIRSTGLTQAQVAEETGIPQPTISKLERGAVADVMSANYRALLSLYERKCKGDMPSAAAALELAALVQSTLTPAAQGAAHG